eukprot:1158769-Pelagomonas_calceolata.AAC.1
MARGSGPSHSPQTPACTAAARACPHQATKAEQRAFGINIMLQRQRCEHLEVTKDRSGVVKEDLEVSFLAPKL